MNISLRNWPVVIFVVLYDVSREYFDGAAMNRLCLFMNNESAFIRGSDTKTQRTLRKLNGNSLKSTFRPVL